MDVNWYQDDDHADDKIDDDELGIEVEVLPSIKPRGLPKTLDDEVTTHFATAAELY